MRLGTAIEHRRLVFHKPAGTSRGIYQTHDVWYIKVWNTGNPQVTGVGECAPLPDLSCDAGPDYPERIQHACRLIEDCTMNVPDEKLLVSSFLSHFSLLKEEFFLRNPSIRFGVETALLDLFSEQHRLFDTPFSQSREGIPINGLIWMGTYSNMSAQIREKLDKGFRCIKLKIGAIDFDDECRLLEKIRLEYTAEDLILRVDANGAFTPAEALEKLKRLSELQLHSIEQPIRAGQAEDLAHLCINSPLPIALDEELIGVHTNEAKQNLLDAIKPPYLVLKPSLHGGMQGCEEWTDLAKERNIGWWITSALESNIGLNAVAQWCATHPVSMHQGLGTGLLYKNNVEMPLCIEGQHLWFRPN